MSPLLKSGCGQRNDGSQVETVYDRLTGQPTQVTTGAVSTASLDAAWRLVQATCANRRGETLYAYDLDGRLVRQATKTESTDWTTSYGCDATGRNQRVDCQGGSFTTTSYNPDSTVKEQRTRDGLTLSYTYDAANRPTAAVPSGEVPETLEALDAGDATTWDWEVLSRPVEERRGDSSHKAANPSYDFGGRPAGERVKDKK